METPTKLYLYFITALRSTLNERGRGALKALAIDAKMSNSFLSQIVSEKSEKKASLGTQYKLADALGYSYEDFLTKGRGLCGEGEAEGLFGTPPAKQDIAPPEKRSGSKMDDEAYRLQWYERELEAQRNEVTYLRERVRLLEAKIDGIEHQPGKKNAG